MLAQIVLIGYLTLGAAAVLWLAVRRMAIRIHAWRTRSIASITPPHDPAVVVTLVHGTWARHAPWTHAESPLCRALLSLEGGVALLSFAWSGRNRSLDRERAAERLSAGLRETTGRYPRARHFVIAHSHGGNVALYALRDPELRQKVCGLVCLSTPFLHLERRDLGPIGGRWIAAALVCGLMMAGTVGLPLVGLSGDAALAISLPVVGVGAWALMRWSRTTSERLVDALALPDAPPVPTLIVRAAGDEAGAALGAVRFLSWIVSSCWVRPATTVAETAGIVRAWGQEARRRASLAGLALVVGAALAVVQQSSGALLPSEELVANLLLLTYGVVIGAAAAVLFIWWLSVGAGLYGVVLAFVVGGMLLAPLLAVLTALALPFGRDLALAALRLDINAEPVPPGPWLVHQLRRPVAAGGPPTADPASPGPLALRHSTPVDPEAIRVTTAWMRDRHARDETA